MKLSLDMLKYSNYHTLSKMEDIPLCYNWILVSTRFDRLCYIVKIIKIENIYVYLMHSYTALYNH